jgi:hypothetical protein
VPKQARTFSYLVPHLAAIGLMILALFEARKIAHLRTQLRVKSAAVSRLAASNSLVGMRLVALDAKDPAYAAARVLIAWDPNRDRGIVSPEGLPDAPAGHEYRLWVLDPTLPAPIAAGVVGASRSFTAVSVNVGDPGFALSLEAIGGENEPSGPILFAVAPGP